MNTAHTYDRLRGLRLALIASVITTAIGASTLGSASQSAFAINTTITGTVFEDFNNNGAQDTTVAATGIAADRGVGGVTVTAFDVTGANVGATTSGPTGAYSLFVATPAGPFRLEFSTLPAGYQPAFAGAGNGTSVQFAPDGVASVRNFGIVNPANYCQDNPRLVTTCFAFGNNLTGQFSGRGTVLSFPYTATGINPSLQLTEAIASQTGAVYGVAYQRQARQLFVSAFTKRAVSFGPGTGLPTSDGTGTIYRVPVGTPAPDGVPFVDLDDLFGANTTGANPHTDLNPNFGGGDFDSGAFDAVGRVGLGGIDLSEDGRTLWVMNLFNGSLYRLPLGVSGTTVTPPTAAQVTSFPVPSPGCVNGSPQPFGVKAQNNLVYVGGVCNEQASGTLTATANLQAYVYSFNPATNVFSPAPVLQFPLTYPRTCADVDVSYPTQCTPGVPGSSADWRPWLTAPFNNTFPFPAGKDGGFTAHPQPMLADIAFVGNDMVVGFRDRFSDQIGFEDPGPFEDFNPGLTGMPAGDLLRASPNGAGGWTLESNSQSVPPGAFGPTGGAGTGQGPDNGEFYWGDDSVISSSVPGRPIHDETSFGSIGYVPGFPDLATSGLDPVRTFTAGTLFLNNTSGNQVRGYEIYPPIQPGSLVKANGLGDIVPLCDEAPLQLGNRVWNDLNSNGRQDPNEPALANVAVELTDAVGTVLATATTAADGTYYFPTATSAAIQQNTAYQVRVITAQPALAGLSLTQQNSVAGGNGVSDTSNNAITDVRDSDAATSGAFAVIPYTTGGAGASNHGLDFGFTGGPPPPQFDWGDNPDTGVGTGAGNYNTLLNDNGPRHQIVPGLLMGLTIDAEPDGQPNATANGDDINLLYPGVADDEDGVTVADLTLTIGSAADVRVNATNTTGQGATLCGFVDFNGDGDFTDAGETATSGVPNGSNNTQFTLAFGNVPAGSASATYARFRLANGTAACVATGAAETGEVEDYPVVIGTTPPPRIILGNQVWYDTNNNGILDVGEFGVPNVGMQLYFDTNADCIYSTGDTLLGTTATGPTGYYTFTNLLPSTGPSTGYIVVITGTNFAPGGPLNNYQSSDGDIACNVQNQNERDHGVVVNGALGSGGFVSSRAMILTADNLTYDFGFYRLALGNLVWNDNNNNATRDQGETGIPNVPVRLLNCASQAVLDSTTTDTNGIYTFTNMISGTYCVQIVISTGYSSTDIPTTADPNNNVDNDDNGLGSAKGPVSVTSNAIVMIPGSPGALNNNIINNAAGSTTNPTMDFGVRPDPTAVTLSSFTAAVQSGGVKVAWTTAMERDTWGYFVLRSTTGKRADGVKVSAEIMVAKGANGGGASYSLVDPAGGTNNRYWLQEIEVSGQANDYGPVTASAPAVSTNPNPQPQPLAAVVNPAPVPVAVPPAPAAAVQAPAPASALVSAPSASQNSAPAPAPVVAGNGVPGASSAPATNAQAVTAAQVQAPVAPAAPAVVAEAGNANASQAVVAVVAPVAHVEEAAADEAQEAQATHMQTQQIVASSSEMNANTAIEAAPAFQSEASGVSNAVNVVRGSRAAKTGEVAIQPVPAQVEPQQGGSALPLAAGLGLLALIGVGISGTALFVARRRKLA